MPPLALSYSRAHRFEECPARFKAEYIDKLPAPKTLPLLTGSFMHEVLDEYHKHLVKTGQRSDYAKIEEIFEAHWRNPAKRTGIPEVLRPELWDLLIRTREGVVLRDPQQVVGSEIELALTREWAPTKWLAKDVFLRMKIDRLELDAGVAVVWDYKTGHRIEDAAESMQLKLYGLGVKTVLPDVREVRVELFYARLRVLKSHELQEAEIEQARSWIIGVSDQVEQSRLADKWPATPGPACMDCPIFEHCPARRAKTGELPPANADDAEELLARWILVDRERKDLQERLSAWIKQAGPVVTNGMSATFSVARELEFALPGLRQVLEDRGLQLLDFVKADNEMLRRAASRDENLRAALDSIAFVRPSTRFVVKRAGG